MRQYHCYCRIMIMLIMNSMKTAVGISDTVLLRAAAASQRRYRPTSLPALRQIGRRSFCNGPGADFPSRRPFGDLGIARSRGSETPAEWWDEVGSARLAVIETRMCRVTKGPFESYSFCLIRCSSFALYCPTTGSDRAESVVSGPGHAPEGRGYRRIPALVCKPIPRCGHQGLAQTSALPP
jgi:hypothetical protein